jgi:hypothetical protein
MNVTFVNLRRHVHRKVPILEKSCLRMRIDWACILCENGKGNALQVLPPLKCDRAKPDRCQSATINILYHDCMIGTPNCEAEKLCLVRLYKGQFNCKQVLTQLEILFECFSTTVRLCPVCPVPRLRRDNVLFDRPQTLHTALTPRITSAKVYWT